jgi:hypothetical protein
MTTMARPRTGIIPANPLQQVTERHREMMRREVCGERPADIARDMGVSTGRLSVIQNSPAYQEELDTLRREADKEAANIAARIRKLGPLALTILEDELSRGICDMEGNIVSPELRRANICKMTMAERTLRYNISKDLLKACGYFDNIAAKLINEGGLTVIIGERREN